MPEHSEGWDPYAPPKATTEPEPRDFQVLPDGRVRLRLGLPLPRVCFRCGTTKAAWIGPRMRPRLAAVTRRSYGLPRCAWCLLLGLTRFFAAVIVWLVACSIGVVVTASVEDWAGDPRFGFVLMGIVPVLFASALAWIVAPTKWPHVQRVQRGLMTITRMGPEAIRVVSEFLERSAGG